MSHRKDLADWLNRIGLGEFQDRLHKVGIRHLCHRDYVYASELEELGMSAAQAKTFLESDQVPTYQLRFMR